MRGAHDKDQRDTAVFVKMLAEDILLSFALLYLSPNFALDPVRLLRLVNRRSNCTNKSQQNSRETTNWNHHTLQFEARAPVALATAIHFHVKKHVFAAALERATHQQTSTGVLYACAFPCFEGHNSATTPSSHMSCTGHSFNVTFRSMSLDQIKCFLNLWTSLSN